MSCDSVKLIAGLLYGDRQAREKACGELIDRFGRIDFVSDPIPFTFTDHYSREMGDNLTREFIGFKDLVPRGSLPAIKQKTIEIEKSLLRPGTVGRRINIDPGYLALEKMVLASTKNFTHRIYLADGIYADLTLCFIHGTYRTLEWTFPDYRLESTIKMFNQWREQSLRVNTSPTVNREP